jgi:hypothetical protein
MIDYRGYEINITTEDVDEKAIQVGNVDKVINLIKDGMNEEEACLKINKDFRKDFRRWTGQPPLTGSKSNDIDPIQFNVLDLPETLSTLKKEYENFPDVLSAITVLEAIIRANKEAKEKELKDLNVAKDEKDADEIKSALEKLSPEARKNLLAELSQE